jgi:predicted transcriptional regulator
MRPSLDPKLCQSIIEKYRKGLKQKAIALELDTAQSNVSRVLSIARKNSPEIPRRYIEAEESRLRIIAVSQLGPRGHPLNLDYM